jgi:hypothetical protein
MRTTLNLSDELMRETMELSGIGNKTKLIETALSLFLRRLKRDKIKQAFGKIRMDIDIIDLRENDRHG